MGKFDAQERQAQGRPVPEEIQRLLSSLVATSTETGEIVDIYEAAGHAQALALRARPRVRRQDAAGREPAPGDRGAARPADRGDHQGDAPQPRAAPRVLGEAHAS